MERYAFGKRLMLLLGIVYVIPESEERGSWGSAKADRKTKEIPYSQLRCSKE